MVIMKFKKIKYTLIVFILLQAAAGAYLLWQTSKTDTEEVDLQEGREYAYKSLTGQESPALLEAPKAENEYDENITYKSLTDEEMIKQVEEETGKKYEIIETEHDKLVLNKMFNTLFGNGFKIDETVVDIDEQYKLTMEHEVTGMFAKELENEVERFITGSFSWDYRNTDNKEDFLAYRVGKMFYRDRVYNAADVYGQIHNKIKEQKLTITSSINPGNAKVYLHPNGGYIIDKEVTLVFNQSDEENGIEKGEEYTFNYRAEFNFATPTENDLWFLWKDNELGVLTLTDQYVYKDLMKGG